MNTKIKNIVVCVVMAATLLVFSLLFVFLPKADFLESERRAPAKFPEFSLETVMKDGTEYNDSFMSKFETYALDAFPFRDTFRTIKAICANYVFGQLDNNNIFIADGYAAEMQYPLKDNMITTATNRFNSVYETFLKDKNVNTFISVIPDKAYFIGESSGHLSMDYKEFIDKVCAQTEFAEYIDITGALSIEDYYKTDTHWRQENLTDVAALLVNGMGGKYDSVYEKQTLDNPFYGVYYGQAALPMPAETMYYLTNDNMANIKVTDFQNNKEIQLYDMEKAFGKDPYDMYMSGELSMTVIENSNAKTDKQLVVFRDSFGRSILPLLADDYAKITVLDIRYMSNMTLKMLETQGAVSFDNADVLFLYSTLVLNNSGELNK